MSERKETLMQMAASLHSQVGEVDIAVNIALAIEKEVEQRIRIENQTHNIGDPGR